MTLIAGLLDVLLRGLGLIASAVAIGGMGYLFWVLRPLNRATLLVRETAITTALRWVMRAAIVVAGCRIVVVLALHPWALADSDGRWPMTEFLGTGYARAGLFNALLALALAAIVRPMARGVRPKRAWLAAGVVAASLLVSSAWLTHAVGRLEHQDVLMAGTVLHQAGGFLWVGGLIHLAVFWTLWRRHPEERDYGLSVMRRFSSLAMVGVSLLLAPGFLIAWCYIGDWAALVGTGYGVMVLTKAVLLAAALGLGGLNLLLVRRWMSAVAPSKAPLRIRAFVEAEVGLGITVLLAAAALTSLPPAVDLTESRATPTEVLLRFTPKAPRLVSPPVGDLLAVAGPIDDTLSLRQPEEYAWSEFNHNIAGLFVLVMGLCAMLERSAKVRWARHWPLIFLGLASFMFLRSDPRAWPLGPAGFWESMLLPDVLQHRLAVLVVVALGVFEWSVRTARLSDLRWRYVFPLLCATGGALLLTHSHAMFNLKSEFLTEVSHAPIGVLAVYAGWGRWLELRLPPEDRRIPGWIWSIAFALIGLFLLFYREG